MAEVKGKPSRRGGHRPGAGRKPGAKSKRSKEAEAKAKAMGKLPLDIMLEVMHAAYAKNDFATAFLYAKDVAPYIHPKLSTTELKGAMPMAPQPAVINIIGVQSTKKAGGH